MQEIQEIDEKQLRPIFDPSTTRQSILDRTKTAFETKFPLENDKVRLEVSNLSYPEKQSFGIADTKRALMEGRRLSIPLHGDVRLIDKVSGQVLDEKKHHLMANIPYMTDRGTFVNKGTEYVVVNQSRLRPGVYTRRKDNGELEAHINVKAGTGSSMRMFMEPETGVYRMKVGDSQIKLMPVLRNLGVSDDEMKSAWGPEVYEANKSAYDDQAFDKFYDRLVGARGSAYLRRLREDNADDAEEEGGMEKEAAITEEEEKWFSALTDAIAKEATAEISVEDTLGSMGWGVDPENGNYSLIEKSARVFAEYETVDLNDDMWKVADAASGAIAGGILGGIAGGAGGLVVSTIQSLRLGEMISGKKVPEGEREKVKWMKNLAVGTGLGAVGGGALGAFAAMEPGEQTVEELTKATRTKADIERNLEVLADPIRQGDKPNVAPVRPPSIAKGHAMNEEMFTDKWPLEHVGDYKPSQFKGNYGDKLKDEIVKARRYGKSMGYNFDYDKLETPVPVFRIRDAMRGEYGGTLGSSNLMQASVISPMSGVTGYLAGITPDKLRASGHVEMGDGRFMDPKSVENDIILDSTGSNPLESFYTTSKTNVENLLPDSDNGRLPMDFEETASAFPGIPGEQVMNTPEETLDHELTHSWTAPYLMRSKDKALAANGGLIDGYEHASNPMELVGWGSRLQHAQYGMTGKRLESKEEVSNLIEGLINVPDSGKFEEGLNPYPSDVRRLFRHLRRMQGDSNVAPSEVKSLKDMLYSVMPALVHTFTPESGGQAGMKLASVDEDVLVWGEDPMVSFMMEAQKIAAVVVSGKNTDFTVAVDMLQMARKRVDTNPSQKQKDSGNFRMGHCRWNGLDITIENPKGSYRHGVGPDGVAWKSRMAGGDYGYIKQTRAVDGDALDILLGPHLESEIVFVVDQLKQKTQKKAGHDSGHEWWDECKCLLGFRNQAEAKAAYLSCYQEGWECGPITAMTVDEFKWFAYNGDHRKPCSEQATPKFAADYEGWIGFDLAILTMKPNPKKASDPYSGYIAMDLDGTLAYSEDGEFSPDHIGEPIEDMLELAKGLIASGATVKILTARAHDKENIPIVEAWCRKHGLGDIEVTNEKTPGMRTLFDDRAVRVAKNQGLSAPISDEFMEYLQNTEKKGTYTGPVEQLKQLKAFSDNRRYAEKNALARQLISAARDEYFIDSDDGRGIVGITHRPSGFRFHLPADQLDPEFRKKKAEHRNTHTKTLPDGRKVDIWKLVQALGDRSAEMLPIGNIPSVRRNPQTGFSQRRYEGADTSFPILFDDEQVIDGRHRLAKLQDQGADTVSGIKVSPQDLEAAIWDGDEESLVDFSSPKQASVKFEGGKWNIHTGTGVYPGVVPRHNVGKNVAKRASSMLQAPAAKPTLTYTPTAGIVGGVQLTKLQAHLGDDKVGEVFIRQQPDMSNDRITNLFVSDKHRGKGVGRSLMQKAIEDYGKERELRLRARPGFSQGSAPDQNDLISFYKGLGFETFDDQGNMKRPAPMPVGNMKAASMLSAPGSEKTASAPGFDIASLTSQVQSLITTGKTAAANEKEELEEKLTPEDRVQLVRAQLGRMQLDPEISSRNLGMDFGDVGTPTLLETSRKLLMINRGDSGPDDRDSKANQTFHSVDDFMEERILKDAGRIGNTLLGRAGWQGSLKSLKIGHFTPQLDGLIVSNSLSQAVPGINPVELMDIHEKITQLGEGGIPSSDAIPMSARNVHPSQLGIIDPIRTAESGMVGIDQRLGSYARKGPNNQLYMPLIDRRTGKRVWRTPSQIYGKTLLFPNRVPGQPAQQIPGQGV